MSSQSLLGIGCRQFVGSAQRHPGHDGYQASIPFRKVSIFPRLTMEGNFGERAQVRRKSIGGQAGESGFAMGIFPHSGAIYLCKTCAPKAAKRRTCACVMRAEVDRNISLG